MLIAPTVTIRSAQPVIYLLAVVRFVRLSQAASTAGDGGPLKGEERPKLPSNLVL